MKGLKMNYTKRKLLKALKSIKEGKYKICQASKIFKIPRQTLADKIKGRRPPGYCKPGPQAVLGTDLENKIEKWLLENVRHGFPLNRESLQYSVKHIVDRIPEIVRNSIPFKNNTPGKGWFKSFRKRHPQITIECSDNTTKNKPLLTDIDLKNWYKNVEKISSEKNSLDSLLDPRRIYVMDEFVVALNQGGTLFSIGKKKISTFASKYHDENTFTVFLVSNGLGEFAPPLIIIKDVEKYDYFTKMVSDKWGVVFRESCFTMCENFYDYITSTFHPYLNSLGVTFPVTIFLNENNCSCTSLPLTEFCDENCIIFLAIPKYFSHYLNPLELITKSPPEFLKKRYRVSHKNDDADSHPIISLMNDLLSNAALKSFIINKFSSCGLFPFICNYGSDNNEQNSVDGSSSKSRIIKYYESKISSIILEEFKNCKLLNLSWSGCPKYTALFNFWMNATRDFEGASNNLNLEDQKIEHEPVLCLQFNENLDVDDFIVEEEIEIY